MEPEDSSEDQPEAGPGTECDEASDPYLGADDFGAERFSELMRRFLGHED